MSAPKGFPGDSPHHWAADSAPRDLQGDPRDNLVLGFCNGFNPVVIQQFLILGRGLSSSPAVGGSWPWEQQESLPSTWIPNPASFGLSWAGENWTLGLEPHKGAKVSSGGAEISVGLGPSGPQAVKYLGYFEVIMANFHMWSFWKFSSEQPGRFSF